MSDKPTDNEGPESATVPPHIKAGEKALKRWAKENPYGDEKLSPRETELVKAAKGFLGEIRVCRQPDCTELACRLAQALAAYKGGA